jgi:hypothetical protein
LEAAKALAAPVMSAKVSAEGKDVATTTSEHYAHTEGPDDVRLVNGTIETPLKNWQKTDKLGEKRSQKTKFGGGWIWRTSTKLGPPSEDVDGWPGKNNGGKINAEITAADGAGAKKVWVEREVVLRHEDKTEQNAGNSKGKIDDEAGWQAYMKKGLKKPGTGGDDDSNADADTNANTDPNQKKPGDDEGGGGDDGTGGDTDVDCHLVAVTMTHEGRAQSGARTAKSAKIEVVPEQDKQVELEAEFEGTCKEHPKWTATETSGKPMTGTSITPQKAIISVSRDAAKAWTEIDAWRKAFAAKAETVTVVCAGHAGNFTRTIDVYPAGKSPVTIPLAKAVPEGVNGAVAVVSWIVSRLLALLDIALGLKIHHATGVNVGPSVDTPEGFHVLQGDLEVETGWENDDDWKVFCVGSVESEEMVIFGGEVEIGGNLVEVGLSVLVSCLLGPEAGPAGKELGEIINKLWKLGTGHDLIFGGPFMRFKADFGTKDVRFEKTFYPSSGAPEYEVEGEVELATTTDVGINIALDKDVVAFEGSLGQTKTHSGKISTESEQLVIRCRIQGLALDGRIRFKWNFTKWSAIGLLLLNPATAAFGLALLAYKAAGGDLRGSSTPKSFHLPVSEGTEIPPVRIHL